MSIVRGLPTTLDPELIANGAGRFSMASKARRWLRWPLSTKARPPILKGQPMSSNLSRLNGVPIRPPRQAASETR